MEKFTDYYYNTIARETDGEIFYIKPVFEIY